MQKNNIHAYEIPLTGIYSKDCLIIVHTCDPDEQERLQQYYFCLTLETTKCLSLAKWINLDLHMMEYYIVMKINELLHATWINLTNRMLSIRS